MTAQKSKSHSKFMSEIIAFHFLGFLLYVFFIIPLDAQEYTRDVGIYPGDMGEVFSPTMKIDSTYYRNLALHRPAFHSSSYDYNLTAQLITDGIKDERLPGWIVATSSQDGILKRNEREKMLDRHPMTRKNIDGSAGWIQIEMAGSSIIPDIDSINISGSILVDSLQPKKWNISIFGSQEGMQWEKIGSVGGDGLPGELIPVLRRRFLPPNFRLFNYHFMLDTLAYYKFYRLEVNSPNVLSWGFAELAMLRNGEHAVIGGPYNFISAWMSAGSKEEWVYVDLGAECRFDRIVLNWIRRPVSGSIQISKDALNWVYLAQLPDNSDHVDDVHFDSAVIGRYIRILMNQPESAEGYILSEMEVFGTGGPVAVAHPQSPPGKKDRMDLAGGRWKLQRESLVKAKGEILSKPGFTDNDWIIATVPATVLVSYFNAGALPDPNFGDNQLLISDSYFYSDFWYRNEFIVPAEFAGKRLFLNFDGINWKAEVYLNGQKLGLIEGAFTRGQFDVTDFLIPGEENALAVRIRKNDTPGFVKEQTKLSHDANGGEIGADNPTFHASVGWDWIPTIRGRNIGIYNDVYLTVKGPVTIENPFILTDMPLPDTTLADISFSLILCNHTASDVTGKLLGRFGELTFEQPITLNANEVKNINLGSASHPAFRLKNPKLWWPNGYGRQYLYDVEFKFVTVNAETSDLKAFRTGIREMSYSEEGGALKIWINGRRFIGFGGNWGFSESMLRYRAREYDIAVRYHKEMNFTMIRNWVGQVPDDEFFDACDRHGIMIWQDFWLANPVDGPNPDNNTMFLQNVDDFVKRIRNHPSLALYCGRNEGNPPDDLDSGIRKLLPQIHPDIHYISNSAFGVVSGGGPYRAMPIEHYFEKRATEKLHSEMGMPNMVSYESLKQMIPDSALWPINRIWGVHDFNLESAQYGSSFIRMINDNFSVVDSLKEWLSLAQWINYQGYRAMFEAQSKNRMGLLLWMSHSAWPSMVWQTYDYFFEPTAAYFGCKKACEPIHIQWNPLSDSIEVVNYRHRDGKNLTAIIEILNFNGSVKWKTRRVINCPEDHTVQCAKMKYPKDLSSVYFLRLILIKNGIKLSENFYWRQLNDGDLKIIRNLPKVRLDIKTKVMRKDRRIYLTATLENKTKQPALMIKLSIVGDKSRERILPVIFSDNFISLMPGEHRVVKMELQNSDTRGEKPVIIIE